MLNHTVSAANERFRVRIQIRIDPHDLPAIVDIVRGQPLKVSNLVRCSREPSGPQDKTKKLQRLLHTKGTSCVS